MADEQVKQDKDEGKRPATLIYDDALDHLAKDVDRYILEPFDLLTRLIRYADEDVDLPPERIGSLMSLVVRGAKAELSFLTE